MDEPQWWTIDPEGVQLIQEWAEKLLNAHENLDGPADPPTWAAGLVIDPEAVNPPAPPPLNIEELQRIVDECPPHTCTGLCYYLVEPHIRVNRAAGIIRG